MGRLIQHVLLFLSLVTGLGSTALWLWAQFTAPMTFDWSVHAGAMPNYHLVIERMEVVLNRNSAMYGQHGEECDFLTQLCKHKRFSKCGIRFLGINDHFIYGPAYDGGFVVQAEIHIRFVVLFTVFAALMILALIRPTRRAIKAWMHHPGCCATCGYDLRGSLDRCPECGAVQKHLPSKSLGLQ